METARIIQLPVINDPRGNLSFIESGNHIPFEIKRTFWIYDVPAGEKRGGHAYYAQYECIIALSGSFDIVITDEDEKTTRFSLNRPSHGLLLPPLTWRHMENFATNTLAVQLSSSVYDAADYIHDFAVFKSQF